MIAALLRDLSNIDGEHAFFGRSSQQPPKVQMQTAATAVSVILEPILHTSALHFKASCDIKTLAMRI